MRTETRTDAGFSLLEILIVTVVLGIVSSISLVSLFGALDRSKQRATMADMRTISRAIEGYSVDNSFLPNDSGGMLGLAPLMIPFTANSLPVNDHWGHEYIYDREGATYSLISLGKDGVDGLDVDALDPFDFTRDIVLYNGVFVAAPE